MRLILLNCLSPIRNLSGKQRIYIIFRQDASWNFRASVSEFAHDIRLVKVANRNSLCIVDRSNQRSDGRRFGSPPLLHRNFQIGSQSGLKSLGVIDVHGLTPEPSSDLCCAEATFSRKREKG